MLTSQGEVVLARQYRPPLGRDTLEMPAGGIDTGETPEVAVAREVFEETGYVCQTYVRVAACRLMLNRDSAVEYFFVGLGAVRQEKFVALENIEVCVMPRTEFRAVIRTGNFEQTVALGGLWLAEEKFSFRFFDDSFSKIEKNILQEKGLP